MNDPIRVFECAHMTSILLYVAESGGCMKSEIYRITAHGSTMPGKIDDLEKAGLIVQERCDRRTMVRTTEKGARVAELLMEVRSVMEGTGDGIHTDG